MLDSLKIMNAINILLVKKYPEFTIYINKAPKNFKRPSFLIEYVTTTTEQVSFNTMFEKQFYTVTYYSPVDEYYLTDRLDLQSVLIEIMKIFRVGYVKVEDRAINVKASSGGMNDNEIYMDLQLEYYENRLEELPLYEKMGEINLKLKEG